MSPKEIIYKQQIIKILYQHGALSSFEISKKIDKSLSLCSKILEDLLANDLIYEVGLAPSSGGRRAVNFNLKPNQHYIIGIAMDQYISTITLFDIADQQIIQQKQQEIPLKNNPKSLDLLIIFIKKFLIEINLPKDLILGIGIGMPGFIDTKKDKNHTFIGEQISTKIQKKIGLPTFIDNDSSCVALAEQYFGFAQETQTAMIVNIGWGIGLGMILNGSIFRGENGFAGEFSHIPIFRNEILCECGKVGCLETETSLNYIIHKIQEDIEAGKPSILKDQLNDDIQNNYAAFIEATQNGDFLSIESISKAAYKIGQGIAILIHILNPKKVILSGRGAAAGAVWLPPIQQALNEFCIKNLVGSIELELSELGLKAESLGAASLVIENLIENKILQKELV